jgi:hypothetical protein
MKLKIKKCTKEKKSFAAITDEAKGKTELIQQTELTIVGMTVLWFAKMIQIHLQFGGTDEAGKFYPTEKDKIDVITWNLGDNENHSSKVDDRAIWALFINSDGTYNLNVDKDFWQNFLENPVVLKRANQLIWGEKELVFETEKGKEIVVAKKPEKEEND